jgi:hypothetical protein
MEFSDDQCDSSVTVTRPASVVMCSVSIVTQAASATTPPPIADSQFKNNLIATLQTMSDNIQGLTSALVRQGVLPNQWRASSMSAQNNVSLNQHYLDTTQFNPQPEPTNMHHGGVLTEAWFNDAIRGVAPNLGGRVQPNSSIGSLLFPHTHQADGGHGGTEGEQHYNGFLQGSSSGRSAWDETEQWQKYPWA